MATEPITEPTAASTTAPQASVPAIVDDLTVVVPGGIDLYSEHRADSVTVDTPADSEVTAVLAQIEATADLSWARTHTRAIYSVVEDDERRIEVAFACGLDSVTTPEEALAAAREAANPPLGGGDCYGRALFTTEGELLSWRTNGES